MERLAAESLQDFQPTAVERGFERIHQFLS